MPRLRPSPVRLVPLSGLLLGCTAGAALVTLSVAATPLRSSERAGATGRPSSIEVTHVPPLLVAPGEDVELAFDAYCLPADTDDAERACDAAGAVFVRSGDRGPFRRIPLVLDRSRREGRLFATVPAADVRPPLGLSYYAVLEDRATGASTTIPEGGAEAPQTSIALGRSVDVRLGTHRFGSTRREGARVARAAWGAGHLDAGLEQGRNSTPIGAASFDVGTDGSVYVLDHAKRRVLRWGRESAEPAAIPLAIAGTMADLAVSDDRLFVLETVSATEHPGSLRTFTTTGQLLAEARLEEHAYRVRVGRAGAPVVLEQRSAQWARVGTRDGRATTVAERRASKRPGQPLAGGGEVVVLRTGSELRIAVVDGRGGQRAWRVVSDTSLAEVQLAEPLGERLVVVVRAYTESRDEFVVLVLGPRGANDAFSVESADWAETAPLSRFRLVGSSLYQLGSTPAGLFVDRYDLEVE